MKIKLSYFYILAGLFLALGFFGFSGKAFACTSCSFSSYPNQAAQPSTNTVTITNITPSGGQTTNWTASVNYISGSNWLNLSLTSGMLAPGQSESITLTVNPISSPGQYTANINFSSSNSSAVSISPNSVSVTYTVNSPCVINSFNANSGSSASTPIPNNTSTTLNWSTSNCTGVSITSNTGATVSNSTALNGSNQSTSNLNSTTTFTLNASGNGGFNPSASSTVYVRGQCVIGSFYPSSGSSASTPIPNNTSTTLNWSTSNCDSVSISPNPANPTSNPNSSAITNNLTSTTAFTLSASQNGAGSGNNPSASSTVYVRGQCVIGSFYPSSGSSASTPIPNNTSTTLNWSTSNCDGVNISPTIASNPNGANGPGTTNNLTSTTTFTLNGYQNGSGPGNNPSASSTVYVRGQCVINSAYPSAGSNPTNPILYNTSTALNWGTSNCDGVNITPQLPNSSNPVSPNTNSNNGTGNLTATTTYSFSAYQNGAGSGNNPSASTTVYVSAPCYIYVTSSYNNQANTTPPGYSYTVSGPYTLGPSNTNTSYKVTPGYMWTIVSSTSATLTRPITYTPAQSQTCLNPGDSIGFNSDFYTLPGNPAGSLTADNSSTNSSVACESILLQWAAGANTSSFNLYRSTSSGSSGSVWQTTAATNYTDTTASVNNTYYYWVQGVNAYGTSSLVQFTPYGGISPTKCVSDFSISDKVFTKINNNNYTYNSTCIGNQSGNVDVIRNGDTATSSINICNRGTLTATNIQVQDTLTNLANPVNFTVTDSSGTSIPLGSGGSCGSSANVTICGNVINFNKKLPDVAPGGNDVITFDSTISAPTGQNQQLLRFRNQATFIYSTSSKYGASNTGCVGTGDVSFSSGCNLDTGYVVFYNGSKSPTQKEVQP